MSRRKPLTDECWIYPLSTGGYALSFDPPLARYAKRFTRYVPADAPSNRTDTFWVICSPRVALPYTASDTERGAWRVFQMHIGAGAAVAGYRAVRVTVELPGVKS